MPRLRLLFLLLLATAATSTLAADADHPQPPHSARPATRAAAALAGRDALPAADLAAKAPDILPPRLVASPLSEGELTRLLFLFGVPPGGPVNASTLASMAADRPKTFMALADVSKNGTGVVNREHEWPEWAARGDSFFNLSHYGDIPASIDRIFAKGDWLGDPRHGLNESAAARLRLGEPGVEMMLGLDENGDARLNRTELSQRQPGDVPLSSSYRHPLYAWTPANGQALADAALRAFDADKSGDLNANETEAFALALRRLRGGNATATADARRLAAALIDDKQSGAVTADATAAYTAHAVATGAFGVVPPGADARAWFRNATGGRDRVSVSEFVNGV